MTKKRKRPKDPTVAGFHLLSSGKNEKKKSSDIAVVKGNFAEVIRPTISQLNTPAGASLNAYQHVTDTHSEQIALIQQAIDNSKSVLPNVNRTNSQIALLSQANSILSLTKDVINKSLPKEKSKATEKSKPITNEGARTAINQLSKAMCLLWSTSPGYLALEEKLFQVYLYRAFLYGKFFKRNFSALRLNANAAFSYLTGQFSFNCIKEIRFVGSKLYKSYLETIRYSLKRYIESENKPKKRQLHGDKILRKSKKAQKAMLNEAFITFNSNVSNSQESSNLDMTTKYWFLQYRQIKSKVEKDTKDAFKWSFPEFSAPQTQKTRTQNRLAKKSVFKKLLTLNLENGHLCLKAREKIPRGRIVLSEPIMVAKWFQANKFCAECNKLIMANWVFPCTVCTLARFCSETCAKVSQIKMLHNHQGKCANFGYYLSLFASMVHKLAEWLGSPERFSEIPAVRGANTSFQFMPLTDVTRMLNDETLQGQNYKNLAIALLVSSYSQELSAIRYDENLIAETFHLLSVFGKSFNFASQNPEVVGVIVYKLLHFLKHNPLANAKIGPAIPPKRKKRNAQQGNQTPQKPTSQKKTKKKKTKKANQKKKKKPIPALYGQAVGPLGAIFQFSCTPNVRRQLNMKTGKIDYCTIKEVPKGDKLYVGFTTYKISNDPHNWIEKHFLKKCLACTNQMVNLPIV